MATFVDPESTEFAVCPYNKNHILKRNRMPYHLIKCAKSYTHLQLLECPYNREHRVSAAEHQKHIEQCAQFAQLSMREDVNAMADAAKKSVDYLEIVENQVLCDWDDSDITAFTLAATENEDVTEQLNMDKISFSKPVLTHKEGDSVEEETPVYKKPVSFGIGRGKILSYSNDRKFGAKGAGRAKQSNNTLDDFN